MSAVPPEWVEWQRQRQREMSASGLVSRQNRRAWTKAEAKARARLAKAIGFPAAAAAVLDYVDRPDGSTAFRFLLDPNLIPPERRDAVRTYIFGEAIGNH